MQPTLDSFTDSLAETGLMSAADIRDVVAGLPADRRPSEAQELIRELERFAVIGGHQGSVQSLLQLAAAFGPKAQLLALGLEEFQIATERQCRGQLFVGFAEFAPCRQLAGRIEAANDFEGLKVSVGDGALRRPRHWWKLRDPFTPSWGEPYLQIAHRMLAAVNAARISAVGHEAEDRPVARRRGAQNVAIPVSGLDAFA